MAWYDISRGQSPLINLCPEELEARERANKIPFGSDESELGYYIAIYTGIAAALVLVAALAYAVWYAAHDLNERFPRQNRAHMVIVPAHIEYVTIGREVLPITIPEHEEVSK